MCFPVDTHIHSTESINGRHCLQSLMLMPATHTLERSKNFPLPRVEHFGCTFCRCCPPLNYPSTSFLNPLLFGSYKKKSHIKQPDVSPVSSVIHKTPNTPHSSLMLYEKLKLNQGSVIKLSDFCWIRMKSCVCHIVCWKCAWGACGLRMHIHQLLVEMDLLTMGHLRFPSPGTSAWCVEHSCPALDPPVLTNPYKWR